MSEPWRPARTRDEALDRAVRSMVPGSWQGKVAQAMPVEDRGTGQIEGLDPEGVVEASVKAWTDTVTIAAPGESHTVGLSYEPIEHSEHVYWNGLYQPVSEWSRDGQTVTVPDPDQVVAAGDKIEVKYLHLDESAVRVILPFQSTGWLRKQVGYSSTVDYSDPDLNRSDWTPGPAAFGESDWWASNTPWPAPSSTWGIVTQLWLHQTMPATPGRSLTVRIRIERYVTLWLNGVQVAYLDSDVTTGNSAGDYNAEFTVPGDQVQADNVWTIKAKDDTVSSGHSYFDMEVTQ